MKNEEIIQRLRAMGVKMYKQQLTKLFKKPFYCGIINHGMLDGQVVEGKHEKLISKEIFLSPRTIETIRQNMKTKVGAKTIAGLIMYGMRNKLID